MLPHWQHPCIWRRPGIELVERSFTAVAKEMRAAGVQLGLSPVLDLGRDLRWGRMGETFGENPVVSQMGVAAIRGLQEIPIRRSMARHHRNRKTFYRVRAR